MKSQEYMHMVGNTIYDNRFMVQVCNNPTDVFKDLISDGGMKGCIAVSYSEYKLDVHLGEYAWFYICLI